MAKRRIARTKAEYRLAAEYRAAFPTISFWYGVGPAELANTPNNVIRMYLDALPSLMAQYQHTMVEVALAPHMKKEGFRSTVRKMASSANRLWKAIPLPERKEKEKPKLTAAEFKNQMAAFGFGVTVIPRDDPPSPVEAKLPENFGAKDA